jgi:WhiB family redox-sensing transcriptional regulator
MTAATRAEWRTGKKPKPRPLFIDEDWVQYAVCPTTDPEIFHPEKGQSSLEAIRVCRRCPAVEPCLDYALKHKETGVWGATSENQRRTIRRERRR